LLERNEATQIERQTISTNHYYLR